MQRYFITQELCRNKIKVNAQDECKWTPLHLAAQQRMHLTDQQRNTYDIITILCNHGANINAQNESGNTALHIAANRYNLYQWFTRKYIFFKTINILLNHDTDTTIKNNLGVLAEDTSKNSEIKVLFAKIKIGREKTNQDRKNVIQELNNNLNNNLLTPQQIFNDQLRSQEILTENTNFCTIS